MKRKHRPGEIEAMYFDKLPQRCKEIFFEFLLTHNFRNNKDKLLEVLDLSCAGCQSPIEQIFRFSYELILFERFESGDMWLSIYPQEEIIANGHRYIADFLFYTEFLDDGKGTFDSYKPLKVVIECDGHDFHEKTKEQVTRNNQRNYDLNYEGYEVVHFSGSEIVNAPLSCAIKTYDFISQKLKLCKGEEGNGRKKNVRKNYH